MLTNSPFASALSSEASRHEIALDTIEASADKRAVTAAVGARLARGDFEVLVVDTFPAGLAGELPPILPTLDATKALVHRDIDPAYARARDFPALFDAYDRILAPGERGPQADRAILTAPWLVRDCHELWPAERARQAFEPERGAGPVVVVSATGKDPEIAALLELSEALGAALRGVATVRASTLASGFPLLERMRGIDVLVGAGGYNTVWEARQTQTPFVGLPWPRLYDRQALRLSDDERAEGLRDVIERVRARLPRAEPAGAARVISYRNGVHEAVSVVGLRDDTARGPRARS